MRTQSPTHHLEMHATPDAAELPHLSTHNAGLQVCATHTDESSTGGRQNYQLPVAWQHALVVTYLPQDLCSSLVNAERVYSTIQAQAPFE